MASNLIGHLLSQPLSKAGSRLQSQASGERPFSPSARSKAGSMPYPPLPESAYGDFEIPLSPKSRAYSKAPSISPSDSPSQMPKVRPVRTGSQLNGSECPSTFGFCFSSCRHSRCLVFAAISGSSRRFAAGCFPVPTDQPHSTRLGHPFVVVPGATATIIAFNN